MIGKGLHPAAKNLVACPAFRMLQLLQLISGKPGIGQLLHTGQLRQQCTEGIATILRQFVGTLAVVLSCCPCFDMAWLQQATVSTVCLQRPS
jgi:hypothetical protein